MASLEAARSVGRIPGRSSLVKVASGAVVRSCDLSNSFPIGDRFIGYQVGIEAHVSYLLETFIRTLEFHTTPSTEGLSTPLSAEAYGALSLCFHGVQLAPIDQKGKKRIEGYCALGAKMQWKNPPPTLIEQLAILVRLVELFEKADSLLYQRFTANKVTHTTPPLFLATLRAAHHHWTREEEQQAAQRRQEEDDQLSAQAVYPLTERLKQSEQRRGELQRAGNVLVDQHAQDQEKIRQAEAERQRLEQALSAAQQELGSAREREAQSAQKIAALQSDLQAAYRINQQWVEANKGLKTQLADLRVQLGQSSQTGEQSAAQRASGAAYSTAARQHLDAIDAALATLNANFSALSQDGVPTPAALAIARSALAPASSVDMKQALDQSRAGRTNELFQSTLQKSIDTLAKAQATLKKAWWIDGWFACFQRTRIAVQAGKYQVLKNELTALKNQIDAAPSSVPVMCAVKSALSQLNLGAKLLLDSTTSHTRCARNAEKRVRAMMDELQTPMNIVLHAHDEKTQFLDEAAEVATGLQTQVQTLAKDIIRRAALCFARESSLAAEIGQQAKDHRTALSTAEQSQACLILLSQP